MRQSTDERSSLSAGAAVRACAPPLAVHRVTGASVRAASAVRTWPDRLCVWVSREAVDARWCRAGSREDIRYAARSGCGAGGIRRLWTETDASRHRWRCPRPSAGHAAVRSVATHVGRHAPSPAANGWQDRRELTPRRASPSTPVLHRAARRLGAQICLRCVQGRRCQRPFGARHGGGRDVRTPRDAWRPHRGDAPRA